MKVALIAAALLVNISNSCNILTFYKVAFSFAWQVPHPLPEAKNFGVNTKAVLHNEKRQVYPPSPKVVCEDPTLVVCGENNVTLSSIYLNI